MKRIIAAMMTAGVLLMAGPTMANAQTYNATIPWTRDARAVEAQNNARINAYGYPVNPYTVNPYANPYNVNTYNANPYMVNPYSNFNGAYPYNYNNNYNNGQWTQAQVKEMRRLEKQREKELRRYEKEREKAARRANWYQRYR